MQNRISPVNRPRLDARRAYNRMSRWYDVFAGSERPFVDMGLRALAMHEGERVLDLGCGTGYALAVWARAVGESGRAVGLDIADAMLSMAKARLAKAGLLPRACLVLGDAAALPFAAGSFDAVFMGFTLELFDTPDIAAVLSECARTLRAGGRIGVVALSREGAGRMAQLYEWAHRRWPHWIDCRPIYAREALEAAGFATMRADRASMWGLPVEIVVAAKSAG